jgi:secreted trypsin-like serine protease
MNRLLGIAVALAFLAPSLTHSARPQRHPPDRLMDPLSRVLQAEATKQQIGLKPLIVGGRPATIADHPWQVALLAATVPDNSRAHFCGGIIIGAQWIMTAAHCVERGAPETVDVLFDTASLKSGGKRIKTSRIIVNPDYTPGADPPNADIALIAVKETLPERMTIRGLGSAENDPNPGTAVTVTGWGAVAENQAKSDQLLAVTVQYIRRDPCNDAKSHNGKVTLRMLCAGDFKGGSDACSEDSGGPGVSMIGPTKKVVGIVSWGEGCARVNKPGVYTRTSQFATWVKDTTGIIW